MPHSPKTALHTDEVQRTCYCLQTNSNQLYLCLDVIRMIGHGRSASVNECLIHIKYKNNLVTRCFSSDLIRNREDFLFRNPLIDIVLQLSQEYCTVVKNKNWTMMLFSRWASSFSGKSLRPTLATASLMNIEIVIYYKSYPLPRRFTYHLRYWKSLDRKDIK